VRQGVNINFDDYINMDNDLEVWGYLSDLDIIQLTLRCTQSSDEEEEQECIEPPIPTSIQAQMPINELRWFIENKGEVSDELFEAFNKIKRSIQTLQSTVKLKQK